MWRRKQILYGTEAAGAAASSTLPSAPFETLTARLATSDPQQRALVWRALLLSDDPRVRPLAREALREPEVIVVGAAIDCLARHRDHASVPALIQAMEASDLHERFRKAGCHVRARAASALGEIGDPRSPPSAGAWTRAPTCSGRARRTMRWYGSELPPWTT